MKISMKVLALSATSNLFLAAVLALTAGSSFGQCTEDFELLAYGGGPFYSLGSSVAISGTTAIAGTIKDDDNGQDSGAAYLFDTTTGLQLAKLLPNDGAAGDSFGVSVAISGTTALVGAHQDDDNGQDSGAAYLFDTTTGLQIARLLPSDGGTDDNFGSSVAMSGSTAIVGAAGDDDNGQDSGAAYLFDTTTGLQIAKLLPSIGVADERFGRSVSISGTTAIVGASGSAYLFDTNSLAQVGGLVSSNGVADERFGRSVSISGTAAIVGASGAAYLFDTNTSAQVGALLPNDPDGITHPFGISVAISGATAIVGDWYDDDNGTGSGSAYLFDTNWSAQIAKLLPSDGMADEYFGWSVALSGSTAIVGAYQHTTPGTGSYAGAAYLFSSCTDCNGNGVPDLDDIAAGTSPDCNSNNTPDDCEVDCNENMVPDDCDISSGLSLDCNANDVPDECEALGTTYCVAAANSVSPTGATIWASGSSSLAANDLVLMAGPVPVNEFGVFFQAAARVQFLFGDGFQCAAGGIVRVWPATPADGAGTITKVVNLTGPDGTWIAPGVTRNFQCWYRDPAGGPNGFNLSDGLEVCFY